MTTPPNSPPSIPTFAHHLRARRLPHLPVGQDAFRRAGPVARLRGAADHRHLSRRFRLDAGLPQARRAHRLVVSQSGSVTGAGVAEITNQMEYDDEVAFHAAQKLYDLARASDDAQRPWCLTVSFTHPHDPYVARRHYWDLYEDCPALDPEVGFIPYDDQDPHSQRLYRASDYDSFRHHAGAGPPLAARLFRQHLLSRRQGRRAAVDVLERTRMLDDTVILFCSDHGDMLGERGLWFKMCFFEGSARVPLMIAGTGIPAGLHRHAGLQPRRVADALRPRRHRHRGDRAVDRRPVAAAADSRARNAHRPGADGICRRRLQRAVGGDPRRPLQIRPLRDRPAAAVRSRSRSARADQPRRRSGACRSGGGLHRQGARALGHGGLRRRRAREPGAALGGLSGAAQRRLLPLGIPAAAEGVGALHAQPHGPRLSKSSKRFPRGE